MRVGLQPLHELFSGPIWGDHNLLELGWATGQLLPVVEQLRPRLLEGWPPKSSLAAAACARSLFVEWVLMGQPLRYSRRADTYNVPKRYRLGDPLYSRYLVTRSMDLLEDVGLIGQEIGSRASGRQSVAWPTDELVGLLEPVVTVRERRGLPVRVETVVLHDRVTKKDIDYRDSVDTHRMRSEMRIINDHLSRIEILHREEVFGIPLLRRVFSGSLDLGGRAYCKGGLSYKGLSYQNIRSEDRKKLRMVIDGSEYPVVEIDYASIHVTIAYSEIGVPPPSGDLYAIEGFDRTLVKLAVNIILNASSDRKAIGAISKEIRSDYSYWHKAGLTSYPAAGVCRSFSSKLLKAIKEKHDPIKEFFSSDCGVRFQYLDSEMAVEVMLEMIKRTSQCPLPMHDSFLVDPRNEEVLAQTMRKVAWRRGTPLGLKSSSGRKWPAIPKDGKPLSIRGKNHPEVGVSFLDDVDFDS